MGGGSRLVKLKSGHHGKQALKCIVTNYGHWHATNMLFTLVTL